MTYFLSVIIGILLLGVMVLVHELGHFCVAKFFRFRVLAFSLGFGKVLFCKKIGTTEYRLSAIPFGGYVKMAGENPEEERSGSLDEFFMKPKWQRALVAVAGPVANYLSAMVMLVIMFLHGVEHPSYYDRPLIGYVADSSAARDAGMRTGDSVIAMDNVPVRSWDDIEDRFLTGAARHTVVLVRGGTPQTITLVKNVKKGSSLGQPTFGMLPALPPVVGRVSDTMPAARAGIAGGDTIVSIDSVRICSWHQISAVIQKGAPGKARQVTVSRAGMVLTVAVVPRFEEKSKRYLLGIEIGTPPSHTDRYGFRAAAARCLRKTWDYTTMIFDVIGKLVSREVSTRELAGPVGIIPASGIIALQGLSPILNFLALISINLAVLNLFPLFITDGGVLLFLALEAIRRKPLSLKTQIAITRFAVAFFIAFFIYVTMNDIHRMPELFRMFGK